MQEAGWHLHFPAGRVSTFLLLSGLPVLLWFLLGLYPSPQMFLSNPSALVTQVSVPHPAVPSRALQWPGQQSPRGQGWQRVLGVEGLYSPRAVL